MGALVIGAPWLVLRICGSCVAVWEYHGRLVRLTMDASDHERVDVDTCYLLDTDAIVAIAEGCVEAGDSGELLN